MRKLLSVIVSSVIGLALASVAAWGVVNSQTSAPSTNPASQNVVEYGKR